MIGKQWVWVESMVNPGLLKQSPYIMVTKEFQVKTSPNEAAHKINSEAKFPGSRFYLDHSLARSVSK